MDAFFSKAVRMDILRSRSSKTKDITTQLASVPSMIVNKDVKRLVLSLLCVLLIEMAQTREAPPSVARFSSVLHVLAFVSVKWRKRETEREKSPTLALVPLLKPLVCLAPSTESI